MKVHLTRPHLCMPTPFVAESVRALSVRVWSYLSVTLTLHTVDTASRIHYLHGQGTFTLAGTQLHSRELR